MSNSSEITPFESLAGACVCSEFLLWLCASLDCLRDGLHLSELSHPTAGMRAYAVDPNGGTSAAQ